MGNISELEKMALEDYLRGIKNESKDGSTSRVYSEEQIRTIMDKIADRDDYQAAVANPRSFLEYKRSNIPSGKSDYVNLLNNASESHRLR